MLTLEGLATREVRERLVHDSTTRTFDLFALAYRYDPVAFAFDCIRWPEGEDLVGYQAEILDALVTEKRASARGPHGLGKSTTAAISILWFALTRSEEDWKVVTTAGGWRQLTRFLWPEVHKWARLLDWARIGRGPFVEAKELQTQAIILPTGQAFAVASDKSDTIEGAHADQMLYVFDEAKSIPDATFQAAEGAFSGAGEDTPREAYALAISTPGAPLGQFYSIHRRAPGTEQWSVRHVTLEEAIAAGRISRQWAADRLREWGEDSALYRNRVLGEFATQDEDGIIPLAWIEAAQDRWRQAREDGTLPDEPQYVAADIADGGTDPSLVGERSGLCIMSIEDISASRQGETMSLVAKIANRGRKGKTLVVIDSIGVGAGVYSRLKELEHLVLRFVGSDKATDDRGRPLQDATGQFTFTNTRAAAYWRVRELLNPEAGMNVMLPADERALIGGRLSIADQLVGDLTALRWGVNSSSEIYVERKELVKKRLRRSTNVGDVVSMLLWPATSEEPRVAAPSERFKRANRTLLGGLSSLNY